MKLDTTSRYAYGIGLLAIVTSIIVTVVTFIKLVFVGDIRVLPAILISLIVFYLFSQIYTFILLLALRYFEKKEKEL
jgi:hypothetical protein